LQIRSAAVIHAQMVRPTTYCNVMPASEALRGHPPALATPTPWLDSPCRLRE
jgi:hypothetical protein